MPTNRLSIPTYSARKFTWTENHGTVDASELMGGSNLPVGTQVWGDSCDIGFMIHSPRTGKADLFCLEHTRRDDEGEVFYWVYREYDADFVNSMIVWVYNN